MIYDGFCEVRINYLLINILTRLKKNRTLLHMITAIELYLSITARIILIIISILNRTLTKVGGPFKSEIRVSSTLDMFFES